MKNRWLLMLLGCFLIVAISAMTELATGLEELPQPIPESIAQSELLDSMQAQNGTSTMNGNYSGSVVLSVTVAGVFSDTLMIPPSPTTGTTTLPDLGSIDLSLAISQSGNTLTGYVTLDKTLVFSAEHTIGNGSSSIAIGPYLNGSFDGNHLILQSERVSLVVGGRKLQRQFRLSGAIQESEGSRVEGEYRETLWGYTRTPVTVIGSFRLSRPRFDAVTVNVANKAPVAGADRITTNQNTPITIQVLANDSSGSQDPLTIVSVSNPQYGIATTLGQNVIYTPNHNYLGTDTFIYVVKNSQNESVAGTVAVEVVNPTQNNQVPVANADLIQATAGTPITFDVLVNDHDPDGDALIVSIHTQPSHGTAVIVDGKIVYTPTPGFTGTDSFIYTIADAKGGITNGTVTITVSAQGTSFQSVYLPLIEK